MKNQEIELLIQKLDDLMCECHTNFEHQSMLGNYTGAIERLARTRKGCREIIDFIETKTQ